MHSFIGIVRSSGGPVFSARGLSKAELPCTTNVTVGAGLPTSAQLGRGVLFLFLRRREDGPRRETRGCGCHHLADIGPHLRANQSRLQNEKHHAS